MTKNYDTLAEMILLSAREVEGEYYDILLYNVRYHGDVVTQVMADILNTIGDKEDLESWAVY